MLTNLGTLTALQTINTNNTNESILVTEGINDKNLSNLVTFKKVYNEETKSFDFGLYDSFNNIIARIKSNDYLDYNLQPFDFRIGELQDPLLGNLESFNNLPEIGNLYFKELDLDNLRYEETFYQDSIKYFYCNSIPRLNMNLRVLPFLNYSNDCINFVKNYNTINNTDCLKPFTDIFIIAEKENTTNGTTERRVIKNTIKNKFKNIINKDAEFSLNTFNQFDTSIQRFTKFEGSKTIKDSIVVKTKNQYTMVSILDYASLENRIIKYHTFIYDNYIDINNNTIIYSSTSYERFFDFEIEESGLITLIGLNIRPKSDSLDALELIKKVINSSTNTAKVYSYNTFKKDDNYANNIFSNNVTFDITNTYNTYNNIKDINFKTNKNLNDDTISTDLIQIYFKNNNGYHEVQYLIAEDNYFSLKTFFNYNNTKLNAAYQYEELKIQYMNLDDNNVFVTVFPSEVLSNNGISNYPRIDHFYTIRNNLDISFNRTTYDLDINAPGIPLKDFDIITNISFNLIPLYDSEDFDDFENRNNISLDIIYTSNNSSLVKHELIVLGYTELSSFNDIKELYDPFYKITKKVVFVKFQDNYIIREDLISKKYTPCLNMFKGSYNNLIKFADFLVPSVDTNVNNISIDIQKGWLGVNIDTLMVSGYTIKYILEAPNFIFKHSHDYGDNLYDLTTKDYKLPVQYNFGIEQKEIVPDAITKYKQNYLNCHFYFTNTNVNNKLNDKINCSLIGNIKNKYNFMDVFFELQTYNIIVPEWSTSEVDDSIVINEILLEDFVLES